MTEITIRVNRNYMPKTKYRTQLFQFGSMTMTRVIYKRWWWFWWMPLTYGFGSKEQAEEWIKKIEK
jgi:hypothetical protein